MKLRKFPEDITYGSIFNLERDDWWELDETGNRLVPPTPEFQFEIAEYHLRQKKLQVIGLLSNKDENDIEIPIFPSPDIFHLELEKSIKVTYLGDQNIPKSPPPPHVLLVPGNSQLLFNRLLDLSNYSISEGYHPEINWNLMTWHTNDRIDGSFRIEM